MLDSMGIWVRENTDAILALGKHEIILSIRIVCQSCAGQSYLIASHVIHPIFVQRTHTVGCIKFLRWWTYEHRHCSDRRKVEVTVTGDKLEHAPKISCFISCITRNKMCQLTRWFALFGQSLENSHDVGPAEPTAQGIINARLQAVRPTVQSIMVQDLESDLEILRAKLADDVQNAKSCSGTEIVNKVNWNALRVLNVFDEIDKGEVIETDEHGVNLKDSLWRECKRYQHLQLIALFLEEKSSW